jgi:hypothetical protein
VDRAAHEAVEKLVPVREIIRRGEELEQNMARMSEPRDDLEGLSYFDWQQREQTRIAEAKSVHVFEEVRVRSVRGGCDLRVVLDVPVITKELVVDFIRDVQKNGIKPSRGTTPFCYGFDPDWHAAHGAVVCPHLPKAG